MEKLILVALLVSFVIQKCIAIELPSPSRLVVSSRQSSTPTKKFNFERVFPGMALFSSTNAVFGSERTEEQDDGGLYLQLGHYYPDKHTLYSTREHVVTYDKEASLRRNTSKTRDDARLQSQPSENPSHQTSTPASAYAFCEPPRDVLNLTWVNAFYCMPYLTY